jgi:hypothetical protein
VVPPAASDEVAALEADGLLTRSGDRAVLTRRGRLLATAVTVRLLAATPPVTSALAAVGTR